MPQKQAEIINDIKFTDALAERFIAYSMSTIVARSLPDVRDGLKPVHRRILYAMRELKLDPKTGFKKCARVVGDVMGKFHPHGDAAIYDAMVRLAQDFSSRYTMVEGQGNFGNIDGDSAAAMRYTEARLTPYAMTVMEGLDDDAVPFVDTYDGGEQEPAVMPSAVPNLLANGCTGIAVGMATNIPPHNLAELCDAMQEIIKKPDVGIDRLMEIIQGPDFPTGGVIVQPQEDIINAYKTGRGGIRLRAKWHREDLERGQYQIVVTEIPYMVQKSDLIAKIAALMEERKLPLLSDIRDESTEDIRIVVEPKTRTVDQQMLMEHLFKNSELEVTFGINMNVLDKDSVPSVMDIGQVLRAFLNHRMDVLMRRGKYRHGKVVARLEVLAGLLIAYLNLDAIIRIIRNEDEPKPVMMSKFRLSDIQAEAILNMRLRALRKLDEQALNDEHAALQKEKAGLEEMFGSEKIRWSLISKQIKHVKDTLGGGAAGKRRTVFAEAPKGISINLESMIEKEPITVILSQKGWLRAVRGHGVDTSSLMFKEGDALFASIACQTTDKLIMFDSTGKFYTIAADRISRGRGFGEPIRLMADISDNADIVAIKTYTADGILLIATDAGKGFLVKESDVLAQTKNGRQVLNCGQSKSIFCMPVADNDMAAVIGSHRKLLVFKLSEIPLMQRGAGVWLQKPVDNCKLCDVKLFRQPDGLSYMVKGAGVVEQNLAPWIGRRASAGRVAMPLLARNNRFD